MGYLNTAENLGNGGLGGFFDKLSAQLDAQRQSTSLVAAYDGKPQPQGLLSRLLGLGGDQSAAAPGATAGAPMQLQGAAPASASPAPSGILDMLQAGSPDGSMPIPSQPAAPSPSSMPTSSPRVAPMAYAPTAPDPGPQMPQQPQQSPVGGNGAAGPQGPLPSMAALQGAPQGTGLGAMFSGLEQKFNLPPGYLAQTATIESNGDPTATSPTGAKGLFQFTKGTAAQYGLSDPTNVVASSYATAKLASDNGATLAKALGRPPTAGELYLAHQQGAGTAAALLANPNVPAGQVLASIGVNPRNITVNGGDPNMPAGQFASMWTSKFGSGAPAPVQAAAASPYGAGPAPLGQQGGAPSQPTFASLGTTGGVTPATALASQPAMPNPGNGAATRVASDAQGNALNPDGTPTAMNYSPATGIVTAPAQQAITSAAGQPGQPYGSVPLNINGRLFTRQQAEDAPEALDIDASDYDRAAAKAGLSPNGASSGGPPVQPTSAVAAGGAPPMPIATADNGVRPIAQPQAPQPQSAASLTTPPTVAVQASQTTSDTIRRLLSNPDTMELGKELWKSQLTRTPPAFQHIELPDGRVLAFNPATGGTSLITTGTPSTDAIKNYTFAKSQGYSKSFTDYQSDQQKADKAQLVDVPLANGQMQKVWALPGQDPTQGTLVGQPYTKGPATAVSIDSKGEGAEAAEAGKLAATRRGDMLAAADAAPDKIARLNLLGAVLDRTQTGPLAGAQGTVVNVANSLGISPNAISALGLNPNQAVDNQIAQKLANELVMGSIGAKNGGFPASNFSVAERQFIEKTFPNIAAQPGANQAVNDVLVAREQRNIQKGDAWTSYKQAQQQAGKPLSYEDFEGQWQQQHAGDNIFAPIQQKFVSGGYGPVGAAAPQPNATNAAPSGASPPQMPRVQIRGAADYAALPSGTRYLDPTGTPRVKP